MEKVHGGSDHEHQETVGTDSSVPNRLRRLLLRSRPFEAENGGDHWYRTWKKACAELQRLSRGKLELVSAVYQGDDHPHQLLHSCGRYLYISFSELKAVGPKTACPHCNETSDLKRFGTIENIQATVIQTSLHGAYFYSRNPLGLSDNAYEFFCLRHRLPYVATFQDFQRQRPSTNGCPLCAASAARPTHPLK